MPEAGLRKDIAKQLIKARSYGLETQQHAATYVVCAWVLGADFDSEFPAARDTLTAADLSASQKAEWLADWTQELFHVLEARSGSR
ncbi:MAG TPA: hypothetical protein VMN03_05275 [Burkholderiales bacterium]|nr:hypothetical protein [Burkholderiales bacterium]